MRSVGRYSILLDTVNFYTCIVKAGSAGDGNAIGLKQVDSRLPKNYIAEDDPSLQEQSYVQVQFRSSSSSMLNRNQEVEHDVSC